MKSILLLAALLATQVHKPAITDAAAARAVKLAPSIRPGLTMDELLKKLGLDKFAPPAIGRSSGPTNRYLQNVELTRHYRLGLTVDFTKKPARVLKVTGHYFKRPLW